MTSGTHLPHRWHWLKWLRPLFARRFPESYPVSPSGWGRLHRAKRPRQRNKNESSIRPVRRTPYSPLFPGTVPSPSFFLLLNLALRCILIQSTVYAIIKSSWGPLCSSLAAQTERSFLRNISGKKRGSPSLMLDLGRTYALLGRACTYTLQNSRIFVPPNSPRIEGKT